MSVDVFASVDRSVCSEEPLAFPLAMHRAGDLTALIAGAVIGGVCAAIIIAYIVFYMYRYYRLELS